MNQFVSLEIRDSHDDDLGAIQAIYAHHVRHGGGSFELEPPDLVEMMRRRADVLRNGFPWLVAVSTEAGRERVVGYAYANYFRLRPAYRFTVEDPDTWTRPWTVQVDMEKSADQIFEFACHEGNQRSIEGILRGARYEEQAR